MFVLNHWVVSYELRLNKRVIAGGTETVSLGVGAGMTEGMELIVSCIQNRLKLDRNIQVIVTHLGA